MHISDFPSVAVSTVIAASPADVWSKVIDINVASQFSQEFDGADWLDNATPGEGAQFEGRNHRGERAWTTVSTVTAFVPERLFTYVVGHVEVPLAIWSYQIHPEGDQTRLTFVATVGLGESGLSRAVEANPDDADAIIAGRLALWQTNMAATVAGIKSLCEH